MNSLCSLGLPSCLFSRSLLSCHRSYVRRSLSKIINLLHLSPKIGRFSGAPNTHLVLISLIVERLFHRKLPSIRRRYQRQPKEYNILGAIQIIYRPSHIILIIIMMVHKHHHYYFIPLVFSLVLFYPMFFYLLSISSLYLFYPLSIFSLYLFL